MSQIYGSEMISRKSRIVQRILYRAYNMNADNKSDPVKKLKKMDKKYKIVNPPEGFEFERGTTKAGTKYMKMKKLGVEKSGKVILFMHGGAYVSGLTNTYPGFLKRVQPAIPDSEVIFLDYICMPEHRYPYQLNEALDLWQDLIKNQGYMPENIVIGGDSAGGNLALSLMLKLRDANSIMPRAAFLISAWGDLSGKGESFAANYDKDIMFGNIGKKLTEERLEHMLAGEIFGFSNGYDRMDPYVSPVYGDYHDFPPMCFTVGSNEMLLSDTLTIVENAKKNGVYVECYVEEYMFHIYTIFAKVSPEGKRSLNSIKSFLENVWK